jgi:hypothetical protein
MFYGHLVEFMAICQLVKSGNLVYFLSFGLLFREKSGDPKGYYVSETNPNMQNANVPNVTVPNFDKTAL